MLEEQTLVSGMRVWVNRPVTEGPAPAVMLLHERYGPVPHSFRLLERLAGDGFVACLPDLFHRYEGNRKPIEDGEARFDPTDDDVLADIDEIVSFLRSQSFVKGERIGMAGFCLSGRIPLLFSARRNDAFGIAVFHGGAYPRDYAAALPGQTSVADLIPRLSCPVLGAFGELDQLVPLANVARFRRDLEESGKSYRIRVFADAPHSWLEQSKPDTYRPAQANVAWQALIDFFGETSRGQWEAGERHWAFEPDDAIDFDFG